MKIEQELTELNKQFPLSENWSRPEVFSDIFVLGQCKVFLVGLSSRSQEGMEVSAASASFEQFSVIRAYFELIERTSLLNALQEKSLSLPENTKDWAFSKSNGISAHTSLEAAKESAKLEVIERDIVLRHWYTQTPPTPAKFETVRSQRVKRQLKEYYDFTSYQFLQDSPDFHILATFGFPKKPGAPFLTGFGARKSLELALNHSFEECAQKLGFLWGEEVTSNLDSLPPGPDLHQEFYLRPEGQQTLKSWLTGNSPLAGEAIPKNLLSKESSWLFKDLTPACLRGKVFVIKAECQSYVPLVFGRENPLFKTPKSGASLMIHPIS